MECLKGAFLRYLSGGVDKAVPTDTVGGRFQNRPFSGRTSMMSSRNRVNTSSEKSFCFAGVLSVRMVFRGLRLFG